MLLSSSSDHKTLLFFYFVVWPYDAFEGDIFFSFFLKKARPFGKKKRSKGIAQMYCTK